MKLKPAIALYLGESYASVGLFDASKNELSEALFEKTIFLPQISLKNLLSQTKNHLQQHFPDFDGELPVYIVSKYFDRLKQFRLGGSISQVILKGFENSYTLNDTRSLSLAAPQLIISIENSDIAESFFESEFARVKKINPDLNKVVIAIPEGILSSEKLETINKFFLNKETKVFNCPSSHDLSQLRKTLLNAGSEGTKEEILNDVKECLYLNSKIFFFCRDGFTEKYENCELFTSSSDFLSHYVKKSGKIAGTFFDFEIYKSISTEIINNWQSPWGVIPHKHFKNTDLCIHPYSEVKLNHLSLIQVESSSYQLEPGPVVAGRAIKPLVIDLFHTELIENNFVKNLLPQINQEVLKSKINNLFSVLEKGQKNPSLSIKISNLKKVVIDSILNESKSIYPNEDNLFFGPMAEIFSPQNISHEFSWPKEIISVSKVNQ